MENELLYIELPRDHLQPPEQMRSKYKKMALKCPFIFIDEEIIADKKEETLQDIEEQHFRHQLILDHE